MLNNWITIGVLAGATAGLLLFSAAAGNSIGLLLVYVAALPLFMAGLGWGAVTAALGAGVMCLGYLVLLGARQALFAFLGAGLAPILMTRLALQNRPAAHAGSDEGEVSDGAVEWYPEGRLVVWSAIVAGLLGMAVVVAWGPDIASFRATIGDLVAPLIERLANQPNAPAGVQIEQFKTFLIAALPPALAMVWLITTLVNLVLAAGILRRSGLSIRPWAPFGQMTFPRWALWILAGSALATFLPGTAGAFAWIMTASMMTAYTVLGLAVMHGLLRDNPMRGLLLGVLYISLFFLSGFVIVPLVMLAMFDQSFDLRGRRSGRTPRT